ncbi:MAG: hypothetical protein L3J03_11675 [Desulfobacterales bacterium]|nr:hypothetical protein [Desulfobacterales bacterium]
MKPCFLACLLLILLFPAADRPAAAHGIRYSTGTGGIVVKAFFDDNRPAAEMFVSIFAPGREDRFQSGKTDKNGRFAFFPDRAGTWEILVYDRMGHRLQIKVPVDKGLRLQESVEPDGLERYLKILLGLGIIAVIFFSLWLLNKIRGKPEKPS